MIKKIPVLILFIISIALISGCGSTTYKAKKLKNTEHKPTWWDTPAGQNLINLNGSTKSQSTWWDTPEAQRIMYGTSRHTPSSSYSSPSTYSSRTSELR